MFWDMISLSGYLVLNADRRGRASRGARRSACRRLDEDADADLRFRGPSAFTPSRRSCIADCPAVLSGSRAILLRRFIVSALAAGPALLILVLTRLAAERSTAQTRRIW